ncbi:MAG: thioredoxin [Anaerolineales bacterium]|nr:thioredoxin [Anaerolineales bacterium]
MNADILEVAEIDFDQEVVRYSMSTPVVVDFWAPWCAPCRMLGPMLERLAAEAAGTFRLAKVNIDENPGLSARFGVQSIPMLKTFRDGKVLSTLVGARPEGEIRKFLRELAPGPAEQTLAEAQGLLTARRWGDSEQAARRALELEAGNSAAALVLVKAMLRQGKGSAALETLDRFPAGAESGAAERLRPLASLLAEADSSADSPADAMEAGYLQAARLLARGNYPAALDGLLELLRADKRYRNDEARKVFVAALEMLGEDDPLTRPYRDELASVLF